MTNFNLLLGTTITEIDIIDDDEIIVFTLFDGAQYKLYHDQDCCESVMVEDICGDLDDIIGTPVLLAEEAISCNSPEEALLELGTDEERVMSKLKNGVIPPEINNDESNTWTFYKISTIKGSVTIRWHGESNGYYSESVDFSKI